MKIDTKKFLKLCSAMLKDSLFKSMDDEMFDEKIKMYMQKLGIAGAGPVPNSLLADQDLEMTTKAEKVNIEVTFIGSTGKKVTRTFNSEAAYHQFISTVGDQIEIVNEERKSQTGKAQIIKSMTDDEILQTLQSKGHSKVRAQEILTEAKQSSNPEYILHYWGIKNISKSDLRSFAVWYYDDTGARKCAVFADLIEAEAFGRIVTTIGFKDVEIRKGMSQDQKTVANYKGRTITQLIDFGQPVNEFYVVGSPETMMADLNTIQEAKTWIDQHTKKSIDKANEVQDLEDYANGDLIDNIKVAQIKRQKATILQRERETAKSFKETWNKLNN